QNAIDAVLDAETRVFARIDPLYEESSLPGFADAVHEGPIHGGVLPEHAGHVDVVVHGVLFESRSRLAFVAGGALAHVLGPGAEIGFAVAARRVIAGKRNHFAARRFHAAEDLFAGVPGTRRIE